MFEVKISIPKRYKGLVELVIPAHYIAAPANRSRDIAYNFNGIGSWQEAAEECDTVKDIMQKNGVRHMELKINRR